MTDARAASPGTLYTRARRARRMPGAAYYTRPLPSDVPGTNRRTHGRTPEQRMTAKLSLRAQVNTGEAAFLLGRLEAGWLLFRSHVRSRVDGQPAERSRWVALPSDEPLRSVKSPPAYPARSP